MDLKTRPKIPSSSSDSGNNILALLSECQPASRLAYSSLMLMLLDIPKQTNGWNVIRHICREPDYTARNQVVCICSFNTKPA
jgi:hypothetical protein